MIRAQFLFALLSAIAVLAGSILAFPVLASAAQASPGAAAPNPGQDVSITLDEVTPWVDDKGTVTVRGLIANPTSEAIVAPDLDLKISTRSLDAEHRIEAWKSDQSQNRTIADLDTDGPEARKKAEEESSQEDRSDPAPEVDVDFGDEIAAGSAHEFTISVPAEDLGLRKSSPVSSWGPRGLAVQLRDATGLRASGIGFTTWYPNPEFDKTAISILAPVTLPGYSENGLISPADLDAAISDGGALATISTVLDTPGVGIALDPRIIASFESALAEPGAEPAADDGQTAEATPTSTDDPTAPPEPEGSDPRNTETRPAADEAGADEAEAREARRTRLETWYWDFLDTAGSHPVVVLPYGDPDQTALSAQRLGGLSAFAESQKDLVTAVLPHARTDVAWPIAGSAERDQLAALKETGTKTVILDDRQQPSLTGIRDSAHSRTRTAASADSAIETLVADSALTDLSRGIIRSDRPAAGISELVAVTAAIQSEAPYRTRHLLLPLPRSAASANWAKAVTAIADAPWVRTAGLDELLASDVSPRGVLRTDTDAQHIGSRTLQGLAEVRETESRFNTVFTDVATANTTLDRSLLTCTSVAWTMGGNANRCLESAESTSSAQTDSIRLEEGSSVLLVTGEKTTIPVTIVNDTAAEAQLRVRMRPQTPQLRAQPTEMVTVAPESSTRVEVPVEGLANADVPTTIEMVTAADAVLPSDTSLLVRVRADWENIGTAVIGLGLAAVFVIGLVKSVSRGRRQIPEQQLAAAVARARSEEPEKR
ncbi:MULTISPECIES: DUF6049 family protein [Brevibacterium]|uniref:DUF6049 family protein n=1 Tax=Brevibacterium TaxID=1696 RepID=UPI001FEC15C3|nr:MULTISPECIES: DUF6049 family protein [Brevibacterium]